MIDLKIEVPELNELVRRFSEGPAIVEDETRTAMHAATLDVEGEIVTRTPVDTGRLRNSVQSDVQGSGPQIVGIVAVANVPYAAWVEEGTGIYAGRSAWTVRPRPGRRGRNNRPAALRIPVGGGYVFRRSATIKGMRGRHYFREGRQAALPQVRRRFQVALQRVSQRLGGK